MSGPIGKARLVCAVRSCSTGVPEARPICGYHWKMVPYTVQKAIFAHYERGLPNEQAWELIRIAAHDVNEQMRDVRKEKKSRRAH